MEKYSSYKDSGVQWLGQIPSHWEVKHLRNFLTLFSEKGFGDAQLLSVTREKGVILRDRDDKEENHNYVPDDLSGYKHLMPGDFVINKMKSWQGSYGVSKYEGIVSPAYFTCKLRGVDPQFFSQAIRSKAYIGFFMQYSKGIRVDQWDLDPSSMKDIPFILPPLEEQKKMVPYLDAATAKIDEAIAQQQRTIDLLNERQRIILAKAVARGVSGEESLKDSGVSYLGEIPDNWSVVALKFLGSYSKKTLNPYELPNTELLEYSMPAFDNGRVPNTVDSKDLDSAKTLLTESTLLVNKLNVHKERIWFVKNPSENSVASTEFIPIRIHSANPKFIEYALLNHRITSYLIANSNGATNSQKRVSPDTILGLKLAVPPIDEQDRIVKYLDGVYDPFKKAIDACQSVVASLQERKLIIINDVVTGKIKV